MSKMYWPKFDSKFFGEGRVWVHFLARIRNLGHHIKFIRTKKLKYPLYFWRKKFFNVEKPKMYGFFEFCTPVLRVKQCSKNFLRVKFVFPDPENTLKVKNTKKNFFGLNLKK